MIAPLSQKAKQNTLHETTAASWEEIVDSLAPFVDRSQLTIVLDELVSRGLVQGEGSKGNELRLTRQGEQIHQVALAAQKEIRQGAIEGISQSDYETTINVLQRMNSNLGKISTPNMPPPVNRPTPASKSEKQMHEDNLKVKRITPNTATSNLQEVKYFYGDILGLDLIMDHGWIQTYGSGEKMTVQVSFGSEGGSGTPMPDLSIEVDNLQTALTRFKDSKIPILYGPVSEPWGVRRFYVRDPFGRLINILQHE